MLVLVDPLFPLQLVLLVAGVIGKSNFHHFLRTPRRSNSGTTCGNVNVYRGNILSAGFILIAALFMIVSLSMLSSLQLDCAKQMFERYVNDSKKLEDRMSQGQCPVPPLNGSIVIPSVGVVRRKWKKKNDTVRWTEILSNLRMLSGAVTAVDVQAMPACAKEPLKKLRKNIKDRIMNLNGLIIKDAVTPYPLILENSNGINTSEVLDIFTCYHKLMTGKIDLFLKDLREKQCAKSSR